MLVLIEASEPWPKLIAEPTTDKTYDVAKCAAVANAVPCMVIISPYVHSLPSTVLSFIGAPFYIFVICTVRSFVIW